MIVLGDRACLLWPSEVAKAANLQRARSKTEATEKSRQDACAPGALLANRAPASWPGNRGINLHASFSGDQAALNSRMVKVTNGDRERIGGVVWFRDCRK